MQLLQSIAHRLGRVELPRFTETRVQMMPFLVHAPHSSLPEALAPWRHLVASICSLSGEHGVGFLTIDEAIVTRGEHHRRPGLHVDCGGPLLAHGGSPPRPWPPRHGGSPPPPPGHGGSPHAGASFRGGMYVVASSIGSRGWVGAVPGQQEDEGNCEHLAKHLGRATLFEAGDLFWCNSDFVHETLPARETGPRQFLRVSMPSAAPWHANYTPNPLGIAPAGRVAAPRAEMTFRGSN